MADWLDIFYVSHKAFYTLKFAPARCYPSLQSRLKTNHQVGLIYFHFHFKKEKQQSS